MKTSILKSLIALSGLAVVGMSVGCIELDDGCDWDTPFCECYPDDPGCCDPADPDCEEQPHASDGLEAIIVSPLDNRAWVNSVVDGHHTPFLCPDGGPKNCFAFDATPGGSTVVYFDARPSSATTTVYKVRGVVMAGGSREKYACDRKKWGFTTDQQQYDAGGYALEIDVQVKARYDEGASWISIGRIIYAHLSGIEVYNGEELTPPIRIGTLFQGATKNGCWGGLHVHMEMNSSDGHFPCYAEAVNKQMPPGQSSTIEGTDPIGRIGDCRETSVGQCDPWKLDLSISRGSTTPEESPIPACVAGASGYTVALCDGSYGIVFANPEGTASEFGACCFQSAAEANELDPGLVDLTSWGCMKAVGQFPCLPACVPGTSGYVVPLKNGLFGVALVGTTGSLSDPGVYAQTAAEAMSLYPNLTDYSSMYWLDSPMNFICQ